MCDNGIVGCNFLESLKINTEINTVQRKKKKKKPLYGICSKKKSGVGQVCGKTRLTFELIILKVM